MSIPQQIKIETRSSGACNISIERRYVPYTVDTKKPKIKSYHDTIFDGVSKPLCNKMQAIHGYSVKGCEFAAAFTSWKILTDEELYKIEGGRGIKRRPYNISASLTTALPQWRQIGATSDKEREEVRRFEMRTAYHERGHSLTGEHAAQAICRFIHCLPANVRAADVSALNAGVKSFIRDFYIHMSRRADVEYDAVTGHGFTQGAEAKDRVYALS